MTYLAKFYAFTLAIAAGWAWWVEVSLTGSNVEHMLPAFVLSTLTLPSSLLLGPMYRLAPNLLQGAYAQLSVLCAIAVAQAMASWRLAKWLSKA